MAYATLILLRHGESVYNKENLFTGWTDVALSEKGRAEAVHAGEALKAKGLYPDICFTSWLKRAIHTAQIALEQMKWEHIDAYRSWRLNERHYGAWQQRNKDAVRQEVGDAHFLSVRRGYDTPPPPLDDVAYEALKHDPKYRSIDASLLPRSESLADTRKRTAIYVKEAIMPQLHLGKTVLVSAHGNSLRAMVMMLEQLSPEEIVKREIATAKPLLYLFDQSMNLIEKKEIS